MAAPSTPAAPDTDTALGMAAGAENSPSAPWELIAAATQTKVDADEENRKRVLREWHAELQHDREAVARRTERTQSETRELVRAEFRELARQSEKDQVQNGGWTDAEVAGDQPGANAFCMGGKDCPNKGKPARRNELYPVWKERPCHVFGTGYIVHWQSHFNAYCCVCVQDYVENLHIKGENHFLNMCKRRWKALIDNQVGRAKSRRSLKFQKMLELLDKHLEANGANPMSQSEKYALLRKRVAAFKAATEKGSENATLDEQARRTEVATVYLQELGNICKERNVVQLKVPSGITLTEHEAQYLTEFSTEIYVCFLCRVCKWFGRNDHWAASVSGGQFRCCNCGSLYRPWVEKSYGKGNMVICVNVMDKWEYIPTYWPSEREWDFVVKMMEATALSNAKNPAALMRDSSGSAKLDLAKYLANMHTLPGLQPFTLTEKAKATIAEARGWGKATYLHLEGDLKIRGMQLEKFPTDDELFMHWEEFCTSYANAQKEHLEMQHEVVRDWIEC